MKYLLLTLCLVLIFTSCKKKNSASPVTPTYTSAQIWDSLHLQYEHKYWLTEEGGYFAIDTIIFHSDGSITEFHDIYYYPGALDSVRYKPNGICLHVTALHTYYDTGFAIQYQPLLDSALGYYLHDMMLGDTLYQNFGHYSNQGSGGYLYYGQLYINKYNSASIEG